MENCEEKRVAILWSRFWGQSHAPETERNPTQATCRGIRIQPPVLAVLPAADDVRALAAFGNDITTFRREPGRKRSSTGLGKSKPRFTGEQPFYPRKPYSICLVRTPAAKPD